MKILTITQVHFVEVALLGGYLVEINLKLKGPVGMHPQKNFKLRVLHFKCALH